MPWQTLLASVVLYIVIPVILAQVWRRSLLRRGQAVFQQMVSAIGRWSIAALLLTLVLLFAFQGEAIIDQPFVIAMLAVDVFLFLLGHVAGVLGGMLLVEDGGVEPAMKVNIRLHKHVVGENVAPVTEQHLHQMVRLAPVRPLQRARLQPRGAGHGDGDEEERRQDEPGGAVEALRHAEEVKR